MKRKLSLVLLTCLVVIMSLSIPTYAIFEDVSTTSLDLVSEVENVTMTDVSTTNLELLSETENVVEKNAENIIEEAEAIVEEYRGTQDATYSTNESTFDKREVIILTIVTIIAAVMLYFVTKLATYFCEMSRYKKAVREGKEGVIKPKVKIKLKYLILLIIVLDVLIWSIVFLGSL